MIALGWWSLFFFFLTRPKMSNFFGLEASLAWQVWSSVYPSSSFSSDDIDAWPGVNVNNLGHVDTALDCST